MKKVIALLIAMNLASVGFALPALQLDIVNSPSYYDDTLGVESTISGSATFTLRALLSKPIEADEIWYISAAIAPRLDETFPAPDFGSFTIDGTTYSSANMYYGTPPVSVLLDDGDGKSLPTHDAFPTYFAEVAFKFDDATTVPAYNVQYDVPTSGSLYYVDFQIDVTGLTGIYEAHFDLYTDAFKKGDWSLDQKAPFSHDAESGGYTSVPDSGSTLILLGLSLLGLAAYRRRAMKA